MILPTYLCCCPRGVEAFELSSRVQQVRLKPPVSDKTSAYGWVLVPAGPSPCTGSYSIGALFAIEVTGGKCHNYPELTLYTICVTRSNLAPHSLYLFNAFVIIA